MSDGCRSYFAADKLSNINYGNPVTTILKNGRQPDVNTLGKVPSAKGLQQIGEYTSKNIPTGKRMGTAPMGS